MRILGSIVTPSATLLAVRDPEIMGCGCIRSQIIRNKLVWDKAIFLQELAHQFERRPLVSPCLAQHIEDFALGVDGAPKIDHAAIDFQIHFVQMLSRMGLGSAFTQVRRDHRSKMVHPASNALVGDDNAAFRQ